MANGNGHALGLVPRADVPILGQPGVLKGGWASVLWQCNCSAREPIMLQANMPAACPGCKQAYAIVSFHLDARGQVQCEVGIVQRKGVDA